MEAQALILWVSTEGKFCPWRRIFAFLDDRPNLLNKLILLVGPCRLRIFWELCHGLFMAPAHGIGQGHSFPLQQEQSLISLGLFFTNMIIKEKRWKPLGFWRNRREVGEKEEKNQCSPTPVPTKWLKQQKFTLNLHFQSGLKLPGQLWCPTEHLRASCSPHEPQPLRGSQGIKSFCS